MYAAYILERTNDQIIENSKGFCTYRYINEGRSVYIIDIYVIPEFRKSRYASDLADLVAARAKDEGCTEMLGTVNPSAKNSTTSIKVLLGYGMELHSSSNDIIIFRKDI